MSIAGQAVPLLLLSLKVLLAARSDQTVGPPGDNLLLRYPKHECYQLPPEIATTLSAATVTAAGAIELEAATTLQEQLAPRP